MIALLVCGVLANTGDDDREKACNVLLWIAAPSCFFYGSDLYYDLTESIDFYIYQSLFPLAYILVLSQIKGRLSACLMIMSLVEISVNISAYIIEGHRDEVSSSYINLVWCILLIEVALMLSRSVTNGFYDIALRLKLARMVKPSQLAADHSFSGLQHSSSKDQ